MSLRKIKNEAINNNVLSKEMKYIEKKKAEAAAEKYKYNNKAKFIRQGLSGKNLKK